jgi:hypothetical protein
VSGCAVDMTVSLLKSAVNYRPGAARRDVRGVVV